VYNKISAPPGVLPLDHTGASPCDPPYMLMLAIVHPFAISWLHLALVTM